MLKENYVSVEGSGIDLSQSVLDSLKKDGIEKADTKWYYSDISEKPKAGCPDGDSRYMNGYVYDEIRKVGVIVAHTTARNRNAALTWSEVVFQQYKKEVSNSVVENLKYIYQQDIMNINTPGIFKKGR